MEFSKIYEILENGDCGGDDLVSALMELDTLSSMTTQVALNKMLLTARKRLASNSGFYITDGDTKIQTVSEFDTWVNEQFTNYSSNMYNNSIKGA